MKSSGEFKSSGEDILVLKSLQMIFWSILSKKGGLNQLRERTGFDGCYDFVKVFVNFLNGSSFDFFKFYREPYKEMICGRQN